MVDRIHDAAGFTIADLSAWPDRRFDLFVQYEDSTEIAALVGAGLVPAIVVDQPARRIVVGFGLVRAHEQGLLSADIVVRTEEAPKTGIEQLFCAVRAVRQWRALTLGEQLRVFAAAQTLLAEEVRATAPEKDIATIGSILLGGGDRLAVVQRVAALPSPWRDAVIAERIDLKTAERAQQLDQRIAARLLEAVAPLSASRRRLAVGFFEELVRRDGLTESQQDQLLGTAAEPDSRSAEDLFARLSAARFPERTQMLKDLAGFEARFLKGSGVQLAVPENFEGDSIGLSFRWKSREQFRKRLATLRSLEDHLDELLGLLF